MKTNSVVKCFICVIVVTWCTDLIGYEVRSPAHDDYARKLWAFAQSVNYHNWSRFRGELPIDAGPGKVGESKIYLNSRARKNLHDFRGGSTIVCEHIQDNELCGMTIYTLDKSESWYWAHYLPTGVLVKTSADRNPFDKSAFYSTVSQGRLWVFRLGSAELTEFKTSGEPAKCVTIPGGGPGGMTIKSSSKDVIQDYMTARDGFETKVMDDRLWVFSEGTREAENLKNGEVSEKHLTRIGVGPMGLTIKSSDRETIDDYLWSKPEFETAVIQDRLWVFRTNSEEWEQFITKGASDKHVTKIGVGTEGLTVKAPDHETIVDYMTKADGFQTFVDDGRLWVFIDRTPALADFLKTGEPAKCVTRVGDGPLGMTVKSDQASTIDMYLAAIGQ